MIYFIQRDSDNCIKIGKSQDVRERLQSLRFRYRQSTLNLLGVIDGYTKREKEIHRLFAKFWIDGEWFEPSQELLSFINAHAGPLPEKEKRPTFVLHNRIRQLVDAQGLNPHQVSNKTKTTYRIILGLYNSDTISLDIRMSTLWAIATVLGVKVDDLYTVEKVG